MTTTNNTRSFRLRTMALYNLVGIAINHHIFEYMVEDIEL